MKAFLLRHAKSSGQAPDAPLSDEGAAQAAALVPVLTRLGAGPLFSSPYRRAKDTLAPYAAATGQNLTEVEALRERVLSPVPLADWQDHIRLSFDDLHHAPTGGESHRDLLARWVDALQIIAGASNRPVFATHGGMTAALFHDYSPSFGFEEWRTLRNPDLFEVEIEDGRLSAFQRLPLEVFS